MHLDPRTWMAFAVLGATAAIPSVAVAQGSSGSLEAFRSFPEVSRYLKRVIDEQNRYTQAGVEAVAKARREEALSCKPPERTGGGTLNGYWKAANKSATPRHAVVRGRVTDIKGMGLTGAVISAFGNGIATTNSHANGSYKLVIPAESVLTSRPVQLRAERLGFHDLLYSVDLSEGDSAQVNLRLCGVWFPPVTLTAETMPLSYSSNQTDNFGWLDPQKGETVKVHGDYLVILRRGRVFTVYIRDRQLRPVSVVDAFAPGMDADSTWYGDLFVSRDKVAVLGFNSKYAVSELSTFRIDPEGGLRHLATYQMRQDQGVFFPKYTAQLVGTRLVIYTPLVLPDDPSKIRKALPAFRKWHRNAEDSEFRTIAEPRRIYRPARPLMPYDRPTLHTLTSCDLAPRELACTSTVVIGPAEFEFYATRTAAYAWIGDVGNGPTGDEGNTLYRLPFDGSAPRARIFVNPAGTPISFMEDDKGYVNVLMMPIWPVGPMPPGTTIYDVGLLRIPVTSFRRDGNKAQAPLYKPLPPWGGTGIEARFVGNFILYSNSTSASDPRSAGSVLNVVPLSGAPGTTISLTHPIDVISELDRGAVAIGARGQTLHFSIISLSDPLHLSSHFALTNPTDIGYVSQRLLYKSLGSETGLLAAPVHDRNSSPSVFFLSKTQSGLSFAGRIVAHVPAVVKDDCKVTCDDWYDDANALFTGDRIFTVLRYDVVESNYENGQIREIGRVNFAPRK